MLKYVFVIYLLLNLNLSAETIKELKIEGNKRIGSETIRVYGGINLNKDYSANEINEILKKLYETNFFEDIKISVKNKILSIVVQEYSSINSVDLRGEKSKTVKKKVLELLQLKAKESFIENKLTEDINTLKKIYASMGFNFITIDSKIEKFDFNRVNLIYFLDKGNKTSISKINFIGDKKIKEKRLRDIIASEEDKFWKLLSKNTYLSSSNIELDKRLILNYYKSLGYYDVQVLSNNAEVSQNNTTLTYTINAGDRYIVNKISTNISDVLNKKTFLPLEKSFKKNVGKYYSPFSVKKLLDELDSLISTNDLQFIEHSVSEILEDGKIEIKINIYEGKKQLVEKIQINGNIVTDESVIRSDLLLDEGDPFNSLKLNQSISKLKSRGIFASVEKKVINGSNKDLKIIEISVEEQPTGEISAGAGIGTSGGNFAFSISENNWLGKGMKVQTSIDVSKESFTGGLSVVNPNHKFSGNSLSYFIKNSSNKKPDSGYQNNIVSGGVGTKFEQYRDVYLSPNLSFSYDDLKVEDSASESLKKQKGTFSDVSFDYAVSVDKRDRAYAPTSGYVSSFSQAIPIYADSPYIKNSYAISTYKAFSADAIGSFKFLSSAINGLQNKDVRLSKRIIIPSNRLRGFKRGKVGPKDGLDFIGGNYAITSNFELSLPNLLPESTKTDIGVFLDLGNVWEVDYDKTIDSSNKIRSTAGAQANWTSPLGPMSFVLAQNITKAKTDITESFKFRLGTTF